ncbi:MAG: DUF2905 domain-containing protein [Halobacteriovoraceae bacterium]|nr:DUF2905 domain-containing protein [Halobacteriovoraceae bacterium]MCB9094183.1 DUF2905 domain-containing protein [Halobacteriovoraceae bacterium]
MSSDIGKFLIFIGFMLILSGLLFQLVQKYNLPLGKLPGDLIFKKKGTTFYIPLTTSILISVVGSFILYLINKFR